MPRATTAKTKTPQTTSPKVVPLDSKVDRYLQLYDEKAAIDRELRELGEQIIDELSKMTANKVNMGERAIVKCTRTTWNYPPHIKDQEEEIKAAKQISQLDGTADARQTYYLAVKPLKK